MSVISFQPGRTVNLAAQIQRDLARALDFGLGNLSTADEQHDREVSDWVPPVDIRETDKSYVLAVDLPGVSPDQLEITTDKGVLSIRGQRVGEAEEAEPNRYRRVERAYGKFVRRFTLPETANVDAIAAKTTNGVLTITIPKQEAVQPRRIEIAAA
jgi:HSP20 family protein